MKEFCTCEYAISVIYQKNKDCEFIITGCICPEAINLLRQVGDYTTDSVAIDSTKACKSCESYKEKK